MRLHSKLNPTLKSYLFSTCLFALSLLTSSCNQSYKASSGSDFTRVVQDTNPPVEPLSPEASIKKFQLPPGYHVELVASEPMIQEPVALAWDGNGRLYVAEMNTYMTDASATGEYAPTSRIKRLEDTDGDGKMDKSTIFIDSLVLPRTILPIGDQLLVGITNVQHIWSYRDTNGDGKADEKKIVFKNDAIDSRNLEHQNGGMIWNMDNWIYPTRDNLRYKYKNGKLLADTLVDNMIGQWGMTTDNYGRLFYSEAGPGLPAVQIQQNPAYGALNFADQYSEDFTKPWPIIGTIDAQGGREALRPEDNTLNKFTSGCGQSIFRGDRLPADMQGDYFIAEPVGRIIKRGKVSNRDGKIYIEDAYKQKDWLASADMNFRPINTYTGPDGCFYIVDMYHGIIQESEWTKPGSYLGGIIQQKGLYKNRGMGRIYRVVHDDFKRNTQRPNLLNEPSSQLVNYLDHPNGWWRDNAQLLLIVRNDQSIVPTLKQIAVGEQASLAKQPGPLARIHALWTLEGLEAIDKPTLFKAFTDTDAQVRKAAVWISEYYLKKKDPVVIAKLTTLKDDPSADVRIQLALSLRSHQTPQTQALAKKLLADNPKNELMQFSFTTFAESQKILQAEQERTRNLSPVDRALVTQGATIFKQLCATCHGPDGKGITMGGKQMPAPPLVGSPRVKGDKTLLMQLLLNGMRGPVDGKTYPDMMPSMASNDDKWIASVLSYVRNSSELGNKSSVVTPEEVAYTRANTPVIPAGMTQQELEIFKLGRAERTNWSKPDDKAHK
ncbi:c-type cytochrome [Spirosoma sp. HMF3257]|uniref:Cytochrome C n=1 Tax=Spirosoma telluris TaxID=2183553 RepID=A0A327NV33_9BACT|nr:c-type cytochrome [Spirosoma telluris]RAI78545.1 cytochrome C [Spirosoma telluris]